MYTASYCPLATVPVNIGFPPQNITDVSFVVQWDAVTNQCVDRYVVSVYWTDDVNLIRTVTVNETSCNVTGLTPNTTYTVTVAAVDEPGCTSAGVKVTTAVSVSMDTTSTVKARSATTLGNEEVTTFSMDTTPTTIGISGSPSINPIATTVTTDNTVTDVINATMLVSTVNVIITSTTFMPINATNPLVTASKLMTIC